MVDPDGKPVTGVRCYGLSSTWGFIKTLPDDTFEVHGLEPGHPRQLIFAHKDRRLVGAVIIKDEDLKSDAPLEVRLGPPGSIKGRLVDEDGLPAGGRRALGHDGRASTASTTCRPARVRSGPTTRPSPPTPTAGSRSTGLKPGVKCFIGVHYKTRPNLRVDTGEVFRGLAARAARRGPRPGRSEGQGRAAPSDPAAEGTGVMNVGPAPPPHPPFGHLLPDGEKGTLYDSAEQDRRGGAKRSPSPRRGEGRGEGAGDGVGPSLEKTWPDPPRSALIDSGQ